MSGKRGDSGNLAEIVNIALALFAWILPNIHILVKIVISAALLAMLVMDRQEGFSFNLAPGRYVSLIFSPMVVGLLEYSLFIVILMPIFGVNPNELEFLFEGSSPVVILFAQLGFAYGLAVGLPITLIGFWRERIGDDKFGAGSCSGCILQVAMFLAVILLVVSGSPTSKTVIVLAASNLLGPLLFEAITILVVITPEHLSNIALPEAVQVVTGLLILIVAWLQNAQFEMIGRSFAKGSS